MSRKKSPAWRGHYPGEQDFLQGGDETSGRAAFVPYSRKPSGVVFCMISSDWSGIEDWGWQPADCRHLQSCQFLLTRPVPSGSLFCYLHFPRCLITLGFILPGKTVTPGLSVLLSFHCHPNPHFLPTTTVFHFKQNLNTSNNLQMSRCAASTSLLLWAHR